MAKSKTASSGKKPAPKDAGPKKKPAKQRRNSPWREIRLALIALIWLTIVAVGFIAYVAHDLPDSDSLTGPKSAPAVTLLAADGSKLASFGAHWGEFVTVREMSPLLPQAAVAIEDRRFYEHGGMDVIGVLRAISIRESVFPRSIGVRRMAGGRLTRLGEALLETLIHSSSL